MRNLYICQDCQRATDRLEKPCKRCGSERVEAKFKNHELGYACNCKGCQEDREALNRQLNHPFYEDAEDFRDEVKYETMEKAAKKYNEPFNPHNWSIKQLAKHAMAENYDQQNYIYGMYVRLMDMERENADLRAALMSERGLHINYKNLYNKLKGKEQSGEEQYLTLLADILENGIKKEDRTGTGTLSVFGRQMKFDLSKGYPLLTTKKMNFKKVLAEYLAFIQGETNANVIAEKYGFEIWKLWAKSDGDLGPIYGAQWRAWNTNVSKYNEDLEWPQIEKIDQLQWVIDEIKHNPNSRRLIVSAWNVGELTEMQLPPCHMLYQFNVEDGRLNCSLYQRSGDMFLGIPFNIAGYAALTHMVAQQTNLEPGTLTHTIGDAHIYLNHINQVKEQLKREPREMPKLGLRRKNSIDEYWFDDFALIDYNPHPAIKGEVSK